MSNDIASILIVDDSAVNRMVLHNLVTTLGHKPVMAEDGAAAKEIPFMGRIVTLADVYDALTSKRVYKEPILHDISFEMIIKGKGKKFDPDVVDAFVSTENEFIKIKDHFADQKEPFT